MLSSLDAVSTKTFIWFSFSVSYDVIVVKLSLVLHSNQLYGAIAYFLTSQYANSNCHSYRRSSAYKTLKAHLLLDTQEYTIEIVHIYQNCWKSVSFNYFELAPQGENGTFCDRKWNYPAQCLCCVLISNQYKCCVNLNAHFGQYLGKN